MKSMIRSRFLRFLLTGGIAAGVNIAARMLLSLRLEYEVAVPIAYLMGMTTAFILMKLFVFERSGQSATNEYSRFALVNVFALAQVWVVSVALARWIFPATGYAWHAETLAHVVGVLSTGVTSYVAHAHFTFLGGDKRTVTGPISR